MQVIIQSPGITIPRKLENKINHQAEHLSKIYDRINKCTVVLESEKDHHKNQYAVQLELSVPGKILVSSYHANNFEIALHKAVDEITPQLRKFKKLLYEVR